jgi:hypothetical protein
MATTPTEGDTPTMAAEIENETETEGGQFEYKQTGKVDSQKTTIYKNPPLDYRQRSVTMK